MRTHARTHEARRRKIGRIAASSGIFGGQRNAPDGILELRN